MVRKINGKGQPLLSHLKVNNTPLEACRDTADAPAETFCKKSSSANYSEKFQRNKTRKEKEKKKKKKLNFNSSKSEHNDKLFTFKELKSALNKAHDSSPGQDKVHYQFLKHLPVTSLSVLFYIFNDIWQSERHKEGLRLALVAFRTSPVNSLYVEANEPSLSYRRQKLSLQYFLKLKSNRFNPTHKVVFKPQYKRLFERKPNVIPPFGIRMEAIVDNLGIDTESIADYKISEIPPWTLNSAEFRFELASDKKSITDRTVFNARYSEIKEHYFPFKPIYTGGSKEGNSVAAAAVYGGRGLKCRLPNNSSILSAEIKAIDLALTLAERSDFNRCIIFSDSLQHSKLFQINDLRIL